MGSKSIEIARPITELEDLRCDEITCCPEDEIDGQCIGLLGLPGDISRYQRPGEVDLTDHELGRVKSE